MQPGLRGKHGDGDSDPVKDQGRGSGKGKDVVRSETGGDQDQSPGSVMSRVGRSAAGLTQSIMRGKPTASDVANLLPSGKSGPSSSGESGALGEASSTVARASTSGSTGGFRSTHADAHAAAEEAAFSDFLDSTPAFVATRPADLSQAWQRANGDAPAGPGTQWAPSHGVASSVAEQQAQDGVEVVRMLSQVTDDETPDYWGGPTMSKQEMENLRQALFEKGASGQMTAADWNNILNFVPDFLLVESDGGLGPGASGSSHMNLGVTEPADAGQIWLEQWNRVLTGYTDEVWGDLGSMVEEARTEVARMRDAKDEAPPGAPAPAVQKLQSVLIRIRARL